MALGETGTKEPKLQGGRLLWESGKAIFFA